MIMAMSSIGKYVRLVRLLEGEMRLCAIQTGRNSIVVAV